MVPTTGTALNIADCLEKQGKLAGAWGAFKEAEVMARNQGDADREREAQRRAERLSPRLAKLAIVVPPAARVAGFELRRDGALVGEAQWGAALPVDAGSHTIEAKAPGYKAFSTVVRIESNGAAASFEVPVLEKAPVAAPVPPSRPARRVAGVVVGSVGIASAITGAVFGGLALAKASSSKAHCQDMGDALACDQAGLDMRNTGRTFAKVSDVTLVLGGVATAVGVGLVLAPTSSTSSQASMLRVHASPLFAGVSLEGALW